MLPIGYSAGVMLSIGTKIYQPLMTSVFEIWGAPIQEQVFETFSCYRNKLHHSILILKLILNHK